MGNAAGTENPSSGGDHVQKVWGAVMGVERAYTLTYTCVGLLLPIVLSLRLCAYQLGWKPTHGRITSFLQKVRAPF